ncbi:[FeFe] hydrogenase H-cluster maturation GTPase HydF [Candidatus Gracilibacteria bacterium]|nr:[FeFe] hydrogenase H-cluster maturation GTPase HydF [Candidatus Gracilibacteria bacterium]
MAKRKERSIIAIIGRTNVGKSSLLNLLSGQKEYAITDPTPGTTADTVTCLMEIHDLGPFKILDTAGVDEFSKLGDKKRQKTYEAIEEADLSLLVLDPQNTDFELELDLIKRIQKHKKQVLIILNNFSVQKKESIEKIKNKLGLPCLSLQANNKEDHQRLIDFIQTYFQRDSRDIDLIPSLKEKGFVLLVVPMDEETPTHRLLRPQDMATERLLRNFITPVLFRPNLQEARGKNPEFEKKRFLDLVKHLSQTPEGLQLIITDSQAFDVITSWTPDNIPLTSFSVMMAHYMTFGNLDVLLEGVKQIDKLKSGDNVLIMEACNHNRKCDDIGTVQIPHLLEKKVGGKLNFSFNFGHPFPEDLGEFKLIIHCGGCMIDRQKFASRIIKAQEAEIPFTNYGFVLAYLQNKKVLERVIKPFI